MNTKALLEPMGSWAWWRSWFLIFLGCSVMGAGFVLFVNPYKFVPGGVYGMGIVLHNIFPSVQVGTFGYMFDIPLMLISMLVFGGGFGTRTVLAALYTPGFMNVLTRLVYPNPEAVESLDPSLLLGGRLDLSNDLLLTCVIGAVVIGIGQGIVVRQQATTGGTDIVGMLLQKFAGIKFSTGILLADGFVVLSGLAVIGFGIGTDEAAANGWMLTLYSLITIYISSRVILPARRRVVRQAAVHHQRPPRGAETVHHRRPRPQRHLHQVEGHVHRFAARHDLSGGEPQGGAPRAAQDQGDRPEGIRRGDGCLRNLRGGLQAVPREKRDTGGIGSAN